MDISNAKEETNDTSEQCQELDHAQEAIGFLDRSGGYDLTLIVEDRKINVCRIVLCIASPVFQTMLKSDFKEKSQAEIELPEKNYEDFVEFLCCFYPDKLKYLTGENIYRVLPLAIEYQVEVLEDRGHKLLVQLVNDKYRNNEKEIYRHLQLAELYHFEELKNRCIELASDLSLAKMDKGSSEYSVSDQSALQIRYLALKKMEMVTKLNEADDMYLFQRASGSPGQSGNAVRYSDIVKSWVESLSQFYDWHELLRAARLYCRYLNGNKKLVSKIAEQLNAIGISGNASFKKELDLIPEEIKKHLTII